ncbi:UTRA domain-containing protein [Kitasatospora sp. NPDC052896]|uniref:UTRA domain-containing protein n=1 Tax=Kitasatospora sp. NPDC052896 TaxID=3364061 RepID=UPI0037C9C1D0
MSGESWVTDSEPYLRPVQAGQPDAWQQEAGRRGRSGGQRLIGVDEVAAPASVAEKLRIAVGSPVVVRRRVVLLDDRPVELTDSYYPLSIAGGTPLAEFRKIRGGAVSVLAGLGYVGRARHEDVTAREPAGEEREVLAIGAGEWVLDVCRVVLGDHDTPIEVTTMVMPARGRSLHYVAEIV